MVVQFCSQQVSGTGQPSFLATVFLRACHRAGLRARLYTWRAGHGSRAVSGFGVAVLGG